MDNPTSSSSFLQDPNVFLHFPAALAIDLESLLTKTDICRLEYAIHVIISNLQSHPFNLLTFFFNEESVQQEQASEPIFFMQARTPDLNSDICFKQSKQIYNIVF